MCLELDLLQQQPIDNRVLERSGELTAGEEVSISRKTCWGCSLQHTQLVSGCDRDLRMPTVWTSTVVGYEAVLLHLQPPSS